MTVRKPLEQPAELKGVFGEGKSVVAVAPSAPPANDDTAHGLFKAPANDAPSALVSRPDRDRTSARPVTDEAQRRLYELRAQSRGLWTDSSDKNPAVVTQPKIERLPRAVLGLSGPPPVEPSSRPIASLDSDAPTSPPPESALASAPAAWSSDHSNRPTDVRRSLRPVSRPSEEATPELDHRSTPLVARPDEPLVPDDEATVVAPELIAAAAAAAEAEELPSALAQAVQQGAAEAEHRAGKRRAVLVLVACVVLIALGLLLGLWPTPWSSGSKPAQDPTSSRAPASSAAEPAVATPPPAVMPKSAAPGVAAPEVQPADAPPAAVQPTTAPQPPAAQPREAEAPSAAAAEAASPQPIAAAPANVSDALRIARAELRERNPAGAEAVLRPLLDANPEDHHIGELLVQALIDERKGNEAAALAQRIIKKRPKRAVYRVLLGDAYRANGAMNAARAAWREALELEPDNKEALRRLNAP